MPPEDPTLDLPQPGASPPPSPMGVMLVGPAVGPYRILSLLGEGGFGAVYLAEQSAPVKRRVALKVIKPGMDSKSVVARFEQERQALALMDHPGVAKVFDAGMTGPSEGARPYFAMELVRGEPITRFCDSERLSVSERVQLVIQVCEAVQHAHMKGVIHRDLKPSNILVELVDQRPVAKIIDFGVAKALTHRLTDSTVFTEQGQIIGTPEYMAPEQARGFIDVDTRADVYSLGAILYQLLTGATPLDSAALRSGGYADLQRKIESQHPPRPSERVTTAVRTATPPGAAPAAPTSLDPATLSRQLRGELDWIVMKCLEKERSRRYDSASALARDLERFLLDEPVEAGPPSASYRAMKFVKRHRGAVAAAGAVAIALVLAAAGTSWGMAAAMRERTLARDHAAAAEAARAESEAVTAFLAAMLESVDPSEGGHAGREVTVRAVLDEAARTLAARFEGKPLIEARLRHTIGNAYIALGRFADAEAHLPRAIELRRTALGEDHPDTLKAVANLAGLRHKQGRFDEAQALGRQLIGAMQRGSGRDPSADDPDLLGVMNNLAQQLDRQGRYAEAEDLQRRALDGMRRTLGESHPHTLGATVNLASILGHRGDAAASEALLAGAAEAWERVHGPDHPGTLLALSNLALLRSDTGRAAEAEAMQRRVYEGRARVLGEHHPETIAALSNLGLTLRRLGRGADAEAAYRRAWDLATNILGEDHPDTLTMALNLTTVYEGEGWPERSRQFLPRLIASLRRAASQPGVTADTLNSCAWLLLTVQPADLRDHAAALSLARQACDRERAGGGAELWQYLDTLALALHRAGDHAQAAAHQREAITLVPSYGEQYRAEMQERLERYEGAAAK